MRYSLISLIIKALPEEYSSLDAFYRDAAKKGTVSPDGNVKHFSVATIERWCHNNKNSSFGNNLRVIRRTHGYVQEEIVAKLQLKTKIFHVAHMLKWNAVHILSEFPN